MGTQHQPRRSDNQRVIDRQTRARQELMRRQELEYLQAIAASRRLPWWSRGTRPVRRFVVDAAAGFHDVFSDLVKGLREVFK